MKASATALRPLGYAWWAFSDKVTTGGLSVRFPRMRKWMPLAAVLGLSAGFALAQEETVYAPPKAVAPDEGTNQGGVSFDLDLLYLSNYVYRGVDYSDVPDASGSALDWLAAGAISFDLGQRAPHPFIAASANVYNPDPVSRFQVLDAAIGADWKLQPVTFTVAVQSFTYPERDFANTAEANGRILLDDSTLFRSDKPVLNPYIFGAYDYELNNGWYIETGVSHDFEIEDLALTITPIARIAYTISWQQQFIFVADPGTGWQHYDLGVVLQYKLNSLLNLSKRWGEWYIRGEVFYTEHLSNGTVGQTTTWGGAGIGFNY